MPLYSAAPPARPFSEDKPTLLVCWWITVFCATFILLRVTGRLIRVERLFREDTIAAAALFPLFVRMALVHVVLLYGTNNVNLNGIDGIAFSEGELHRRSIGSRLVLLSRIFDAATLWTLKAATLEFFRRLKGITREKSSARAMMIMRGTLVVTFLAVVISTLAECQPFPHYWQVSPDPGPKCRQGYANLLTMAICNILTDILLVMYPIPIIIQSRIPAHRKAFLIGLFCLGLVTVIISIYRLPKIIQEGGYQSTRSMWASIEIFVATVAANTLALASFVRDLGVKKAKFKFDPASSGKSERHVQRSVHDTWHGRELERSAVSLGNATNCETGGKHVFFSQPRSNKSVDLRDSESAGERGPSPSQSIESLIPRGQQPASSAQVTKTTEVKVTVESIGTLDRELSVGGTHGLATRDPTAGQAGPPRTVVASNRGQGRGSTKVLKDMDVLPTEK
ncbi:Integral membrane protein Pth11-like [Coniochaeta hoffmannii]|uniref:Integral membrane protein Pth11-like n=1 Tax=Coniochaeta hoffmannii TaxID=91930 RepID=A0AA38W1C0_9PEZI|nr:Integral membrane protein Pth11-like [Coniochaeta hoffmannii]